MEIAERVIKVPMFNADILPDVTGHVLGAADKQWDLFARNIVLSGSLSGSGLSTLNAQNPTPGVDSLHVTSGLNLGSLIFRFGISNPSVEGQLAVVSFKNSLIQLGGISGADSPSVPIQIFSNAGDTDALLQIYQHGSNVNLALTIDNLGRITSYAPGYASYAFAVSRLDEANAIMAIGQQGELNWGAGGGNIFDTALIRTAAHALALTDDAGNYGDLSLNILHSQVAVGTAPLSVLSTTLVTNLNADWLDGASWPAPPAIGSTTPGDVHAALLTASGQIQSSLNDGVTPPLSIASNIPVDVLRVKFAFDLTVEDKILNDGSGFKHKRVNIPSQAAGAEVNITCTWTTPFPDSAYTPVFSIFDSGTAGGVQAGLRGKRITQQDATKVTVQVINDDSVAHTGVLLVHAVRG